MSPTTTVACVGLVTLDLRQVVDHVPGPDEKTVADSATLTFGGPAANAAATVAHLGARARLVTGCGRGPVGRLVEAELRATGVELVDLATSDAPGPAISSVLVDRATGARAVVSTNAHGVEVDAAAATGAVAGSGCLLVDGHHLGAGVAAAEEARRCGVPVLLDGGSWKPGLERLLPLVDVAVLSADFRAPDGSDPVSWVRAAGCAVVAVSHGSAPVRVHTGAGRTEVPVPVVDVVDTLGAGDVLHGGVALALARGSEPVAALRFGVALASLSCGSPGARGWAADPDARARAAGLVRGLDAG